MVVVDDFAARLKQFGDQACPAGLMGGAQTLAGVAVEEFVEGQIVAEVGVVLDLGMRPQARALAVGVAFGPELRQAVVRMRRREVGDVPAPGFESTSS